MLSPDEGAIYREGFAAYDPLRRAGSGAPIGAGFLHNPYLVGAGREAAAALWWQGYNAAREQARLGNPRAPS